MRLQGRAGFSVLFKLKDIISQLTKIVFVRFEE